jgi:hypothetical protein
MVGPPMTADKLMTKRVLLAAMLVLLYLLHQDFWFWREARPLIFGFLPVSLFYHACFTLAVSAVMAVLVRYAWPAHLEDESGGGSALGNGTRGEDQPR